MPSYAYADGLTIAYAATHSIAVITASSGHNNNLDLDDLAMKPEYSDRSTELCRMMTVLDMSSLGCGWHLEESQYMSRN